MYLLTSNVKYLQFFKHSITTCKSTSLSIECCRRWIAWRRTWYFLRARESQLVRSTLSSFIAFKSVRCKRASKRSYVFSSFFICIMIMQSKPCGYSVFVTQDTAFRTASSNCSRCRRCPFGDILCLAMDSCLIYRLLISQIVKTAHKTLTSSGVTVTNGIVDGHSRYNKQKPLF